MRRTVALLSTTLLLAACAPATVTALRTEHAGKHVFNVNQGYQAVYRTIVEQARACYQRGMITAQMVVQGDLYTDIQSGTVSVALHGGLGVDTYYAIDIKALGPEQTRVEVFYAMNGQARDAKAVEEWVTIGSKDCSARAQVSYVDPPRN